MTKDGVGNQMTVAFLAKISELKSETMNHHFLEKQIIVLIALTDD